MSLARNRSKKVDSLSLQPSSTNLSPRRFFYGENANLQRSVLREAVIPSAVESIIGLGFALVTEQFTEWGNPSQNYFLAIASRGIAINLFTRLVQFYLLPRLSAQGYLEKYLPVERQKILFAFFRAIEFAHLDKHTRSVLLHESGHALAAISLYKHANPHINIDQYGGVTRANTWFLSTLGAWIGKSKSNVLFAGSGTLASMGSNCLGLAIAQIIPDNHMELKAYIRVSILMTILGDIVYSLTPYRSHCTNGNDFCSLQDEGISPIICTLLMIASYILLQLSLTSITHYQNHAQQPVNNTEHAPQPARVKL